MLTNEEQQKIKQETVKYPHKSAAAIEALMLVQKRTGWISDEVLAAVADFLGMTPAELDGVATFYNHIFRKPVGKHVIYVCDSISCWVLGYEWLIDRIREKLDINMGETTADGRFTLVDVQCLGACGEARPAWWYAAP